MKYEEITAQLPLPTEEQTDAFAEYLSSAHSWYKHLPYLPPGGLFAFYLDPQAGKSIVHKPQEKLVQFEEVSKPVAWGPKGMNTADYLERHGHWSYSLVENRRSEQAQQEVRVYLHASNPAGDATRYVTLSPATMQEAQCRVTAFLRHSGVLWQNYLKECTDAAVSENLDCLAQSSAGVGERERYRQLLEATPRGGRVPISFEMAFACFGKLEEEQQRTKLRNALRAALLWHRERRLAKDSRQ